MTSGARRFCMRCFWPILIALGGCGIPAEAADRADVHVRILPETPLIERTQFGNAVNMDFLIENDSGGELEIARIRIATGDARGRIARRVEINENGTAPGIETVPNRRIAAHAASTVFNPLHTFPAGVPLGRLDIEIVFSDADGRLSTVHAVARPLP